MMSSRSRMTWDRTLLSTGSAAPRSLLQVISKIQSRTRTVRLVPVDNSVSFGSRLRNTKMRFLSDISRVPPYVWSKRLRRYGHDSI